MSGLKADMGDPFDKSMFEALESMRFDNGAEQLIWERLEDGLKARDDRRLSSRRRKVVAGGLALAMAASVSAVAIATVPSHQPAGEVAPLSAGSTDPAFSGVAIAAESSKVQGGRDEPGPGAPMPEWIVPVSGDITLILRIAPDGGFVASGEKALGDRLGAYTARDAISGRTSTCEVYARLDSSELYSVRFEGDGTLYEAFVQPSDL